MLSGTKQHRDGGGWTEPWTSFSTVHLLMSYASNLLYNAILYRKALVCLFVAAADISRAQLMEVATHRFHMSNSQWYFSTDSHRGENGDSARVRGFEEFADLFRGGIYNTPRRRVMYRYNRTDSTQAFVIGFSITSGHSSTPLHLH